MADLYDYDIDLNADTSHSRLIRLTGYGKKVLEVGCATGYVSRVLTEQFGCTVTGIELNSEAAAKARQRCQRVICGDAEMLDYAKELDSERFDVVLFADILEHLRDPGALLRKIRAFIKPDGYAVASIPNIAHAAVVLELMAGRFAYRPLGLFDNTHIRFFNRRSIYELFESTGYVIEELSRIEAQPSATEFQTNLAAFPPEIVEFALGRTEATTYQFIIKACPATEAAALAELRHNSDRVQQDLETARATLAEREAEILSLRERLASAENLCREAAETTTRLRRDLDESVHARTWKLTGPLRRFKAGLSHVREMGLRWVSHWPLTGRLLARLRLRRYHALIEGSGLFDAAWYLAQHRDVAHAGISPILHYLLSGAAEGRCPNPLFDSGWYLARYPDVAQAGLNPLVHYLLSGAAEGRDPHPQFDTSAYLARRPDVAAAGINPLAHFIQREVAENRQPDDIAPASLPPGSDGSAAPDGTTYGEDDYRVVSQRIIYHRRHQLAALTVTPADMISLDDSDLRPCATALLFPPEANPEVSIVIPVYNNLRLTLECLASILQRTKGVRYEVIVINDASTDDTRDVLPLITNLVYMENAENRGYLRTCNIAAERARGPYLVFLNNDVQVSSGWLQALLETFTQHDNVGAVGPKVLFPDGRLQEAGALINPDGTTRFVGLADDPARPRYNYAREIDYCSGVCLMLRKEIFFRLGRFDERLAPAYYEDVDLCLRLRARGLRVLYNPDAVIVHHLSASASSVEPSYKLECVTRNQQRILETWLERIELINQVRLIAFYLPQYHPIPENDRWWGKGFTEWANVAKAKPNFVGHYQPHLPADLGFYDLRVGEIMEQQAALAQRYGIHGFCYYYYWFNGKRLLEHPLERMLITGKPDIPFCLCWANENWTRRWDGQENQILIGQQHSAADDEAVILDLIRYLRHPNYIRINGRPLFIVYQVGLFPDMKRTAATWREACRAEGIGEIYLANVETFELAVRPNPPSSYGCDASIEFPPHESACPIPVPGKLLNPSFAGVVSDYRDVVLKYMLREIAGYARFRTVTPAWDNSARRQNNAFILHRSSPGAFQAWLETVIEETREQHSGDKRIVFLNAWNEWAEGNHMEPDARFGHGYLEAANRALTHGVL
jgi:GT2 family glycosyltransferase/2-polyprenyl-3-methyl-5-hydroxy-6-metoxy-1,4-benzoquinol methylase